jgi:hypothetical protein
MIDRLNQLATLNQRGVLTDAEFAAWTALGRHQATR